MLQTIGHPWVANLQAAIFADLTDKYNT